MVKVVIQRNNESKIISCQIKGHAKAAAKGSDIVCAAISVLGETALLGLLKYAKVKVDYNVQPGNMHFSLEEAPGEKSDAILETMFLGFEEVAKAYPKNVAVSIIGGESHV